MGKATQFLKLVDAGGRMVEGECFNDKHMKEIDLTGWNWKVSDPQVDVSSPKKDKDDKTKAKPKPKSENESGDKTPKASTFSFSKKTDRSTMRLLTAMDKGHLFTGLMVLEEQFEGSPLPFELHIAMTKVFVVSIGWAVSAESAGITMEENWVLNYDTIDFKYHWRGGIAGWIEQGFKRPKDESSNANPKIPPTKAEKAADEEERFKAYQKTKAEKAADEEERFKAYLKKCGLLK